MDHVTRATIADLLEQLAAQTTWNETLWRQCFELAEANSDDPILGYLFDDLIHYTGTPLFRREPPAKRIQAYSQEFRDFAFAVRSEMSLEDFKKHYEW